MELSTRGVPTPSAVRSAQNDLLEMTHLASDPGSSREVVSRPLKEFEQQGALRLYRGWVELVSPEVCVARPLAQRGSCQFRAFPGSM